MLRRFFRNLPDTIAAIDIGSNSFHLIVAKHESGNIQVIDRIKEMVRLGAGLDKNDKLDESSQEKALSCLHRFGQRISNISGNGVRVVATGALRKASNQEAILEKANELLGHEIEIISGSEEARLTYIGVSHNIAEEHGRRLIIDIGGASTELTLGEDFEPIYVQSLDIGSATLTQMYFPDGEITPKLLKKASIYVMLELEPYIEAYKHLGWDSVIGTAGSIKSVERVIAKKENSDQIIKYESLLKIYEKITKLSHFDELDFDGLKEARRKSFVAGLIILKSIFEVLELKRMRVSEGGIREGILYDLIGRDQHKDTRSKTINDLAKKYRIDEAQANYVEQTSTNLLDQVAEDWSLDNDECANLLAWVSKVREVGLSVSHVQHHRHSEYILKHSVLLGFSRHEQQILAVLARLQRSGFHQHMIETLPVYWQEKVTKLAVLLRLSVLMHRSRNYKTHVDPKISASKQKIELLFPETYLDQHPLTQADLDAERKILKNCNFDLSYQ